MGKIIILLGFLSVLAMPSAFAQDGEAAPVIEAPAGGEAMGAEPAAEGRSSSGLPIPRFVSLSSEKVFVRTGPALRYPIKWVYQRESLPVEVIQEFDTWRKIRDMDSDAGWVHQSLLSGERTGVVKGEANLAVRRQPEEGGAIQAYLEPNVVVFIENCQGQWCQVASQGYDGWAERKFLWGIYDTEDFD